MLRKYTSEQAAEKLGLDDAEIRFLVHHLREFLSVPLEGQSLQSLTDSDIILLARAYKLLHGDGCDPLEIRQKFRNESAGQSSTGRRQAEIIAFVSGRPAAGTSSLVWNLASILTARGYRCTIFDGSADGGGVLQWTNSAADTSQWNIKLPSSVRVVSGERCLDAVAEPGDEELVKQLEEIDSTTDFIFVDGGRGRSDTALRFAMVVDEIVCVTTPDVGANADCFSVVRMLKDVDPDLILGLVINRAHGIGDARESYARINGAAHKVGLGELPGLGWVAEDEALRKCMANGEAVTEILPTSISARCITRLADHLTNRLTPVERRSSGGLPALVQALRSATQRGGQPTSVS